MELSPKKTTYILIRLIIGISLFGHGLVRLPKLTEFSTYLFNKFNSSILPEVVIRPFAYTLTFAEFIIGLLLILGLFTKKSSHSRSYYHVFACVW